MLSGFELYPRWVPLKNYVANVIYIRGDIKRKLSAPSASSLKLFLSLPVMTILSYRPHEGSFTFFIETPLNFYQPRFS